jgi:hypothetical protein
MAEFQAALRLPTGMHATPVFGNQPSAVRTALLDEQQAAAQRAMPFDRTMATPPPVGLGRMPSRPPGRPPSWPPSHISTMVDPSSTVPPPNPVKQTTTFRHATGELGMGNTSLRGKRTTVVAVAAVVALAAAGLIITLLVTRPSGKPPVIETVPTAAPAEPTPPPPSPVPPPQAERFEPPPPPPVVRTFDPEPQDTKTSKKISSKTKKNLERPTERPTPQDDPPSKGRDPTERW